MHSEALEWVGRYASTGELSILDIGGRDINGGTRGLFPNGTFTGLDLHPGPGVDIVADASEWAPDREYDMVLATEVFEHTPAWPAIIGVAFKACKPGGVFVATMAGPGRAPHSGIDGGSTLYAGEHYANINPGKLARVLEETGWADVVVDQQVTPHPCDVRCWAVK